MTPEAVLYRCLQLGTAAEFDATLFAELVACDADLAASWYGLLGLDAHPQALAQYLEHLSPQALQQLIQAQESRLTQHSGSARMGLEQWLATLENAVWGSVLWRMLSPDSDARFDTETRFLLALSGVQGVADQQVLALERFRGARPELLEDASLAHRIFAVIDGVGLAQDYTLATALLPLSQAELEQSKRLAKDELDDKLHRLGIVLDSDADWQQGLWLRQQLQAISVSLQDAQAVPDLLRLHNTLSRTIFTHAPLLLLQQAEQLMLVGAEDIIIRTTSQTSTIAQAFRASQPVTLEDGPELAVVDRQILQQLDQSEAVAVPLLTIGNRPAGIMVVGEDEEQTASLAAEMYAAMLTTHVQRVLKQASGADESNSPDPSLARVEAYRDLEQQRLRELVHEANNPLSIVHNYLHILELRLSHDEEAASQLQLISAELQRAGDVFSRARQVPEVPEADDTPVVVEEDEAPRALEIQQWASNLAELHHGLANAGQVELHGPVSGQSATVQIAVGKLTQVVTNLLKNALEATAPGGKVSLHYHTRVYRHGQPGLVIEIADTGPGLPEQVLAHLAEVKTSTKGGEHQGVGLSVAYRLCTEMGIAMDVTTSTVGPERGSIFTLFIPYD